MEEGKEPQKEEPKFEIKNVNKTKRTNIDFLFEVHGLSKKVIHVIFNFYLFNNLLIL